MTKRAEKTEIAINGVKQPSIKVHTQPYGDKTNKGKGIDIPLNDRTLIIDGDILIYKVACQVEQAIEWAEDLWTLHADFKEARDKLADTITYYELTLLAKRIVIALGSKDSFRKRLNPLYKSNRKKMRKPVVYQPLREWIQENYKCYIKPTLEGDDIVGILATGNIIKGEKTVLTSDKDMKTIPGTHWFLGDDDYTVINEEEANYFHMLQTLTGDATDGYKGCPNIGKVTAEKILTPHKNNYKNMWNAVVDTYKSKGLNSKVALLEARMARILRASDYNFKSQKPILWRPPA
jgi:DNA polymerase-1